jgi:catechol 2,3-dioxygenase-like lactoylglutathione lyase family enzyme
MAWQGAVNSGGLRPHPRQIDLVTRDEWRLHHVVQIIIGTSEEGVRLAGLHDQRGPGAQVHRLAGDARHARTSGHRIDLAHLIAVLQTPDGKGCPELFEYIHPDAIERNPTQPNEIGMHRVAFSVNDIAEAVEIAARHGCHPLRGVATYGDLYKLTYVRGPSGILVMFAQALNNG